jgi:hypothetical protein
MPKFFSRLIVLPLLFSFAPAAQAEPGLSVADYDSIQAALDANPNRVLFVPAGDYTLSEKLRIRGERAGLFGPGHS